MHWYNFSLRIIAGRVIQRRRVVARMATYQAGSLISVLSTIETVSNVKGGMICISEDVI